VTALLAWLAALVARLARAVQDYRTVHVPARCTVLGCTCPCGWCNHDPRHRPGG